MTLAPGIEEDRALVSTTEQGGKVDPPKPRLLTTWPRTTRAMPWLLATWIVMMTLAPFDSAQLGLNLPVEASMDRQLLGVWFVLWVLTLGTGAHNVLRWWRPGLAGLGLGLLLVAAGASLLFNLTTLELANESSVAFKRYALLVSYGLFLLLVITSTRPGDVRPLTNLLIACGCICAVGVVYQYRADANLFFDWFRSAAGGLFNVDTTPQARYSFARRVITGPTKHGLAVTAMLSMIAPFALAGFLSSRTRIKKALYAIAFGLLLVGALSTLRRTAVVAPLALLVVFIVYRPRHLAKLWPMLIPGAVFLKFAAPGAFSNLRGQLSGQDSLSNASTEGRTADYLGISTDVLHRPIMGRGWGSYQPENYRVLDNQYLLLLVEVGVVGIFCFALLLLGQVVLAHRLQRLAAGWKRWAGVAAVSAAVVFAVISALFDSVAFPQATYTFLLIVGFTTVLLRSAEFEARTGAPGRPPTGSLSP